MSARDPIEAALDAFFPQWRNAPPETQNAYRHDMSAAIATYLRARADVYEAAGEHISAGIVRGLIPNEESPQ